MSDRARQGMLPGMGPDEDPAEKSPPAAPGQSAETDPPESPMPHAPVESLVESPAKPPSDWSGRDRKSVV